MDFARGVVPIVHRLHVCKRVLAHLSVLINGIKEDVDISRECISRFEDVAQPPETQRTRFLPYHRYYKFNGAHRKASCIRVLMARGLETIAAFPIRTPKCKLLVAKMG